MDPSLASNPFPLFLFKKKKEVLLDNAESRNPVLALRVQTSFAGVADLVTDWESAVSFQPCYGLLSLSCHFFSLGLTFPIWLTI